MTARGIFNAPPTLTLLLGAAALGAYAVIGADEYALRVLSTAGTFALLVMGYQFVFGHLGALSLAQGAFFGLGAYATAILSSRYEFDFSVSFPVSIAVPVIAAAIVAAPVLRLETHYFALATLVLAQGALLAVLNWENLTGGANGLPGVGTVRIGDLAVARGLPMAAFVWCAVGLGALLAWRLVRGASGLAFSCLRDRPLAAAAMGLDGARARHGAFLMSAAYGGAAGALHAHLSGVVSPESIEFPVMVSCLTMAVIGGRARVAGAIIGALLLAHLPEWFRGFERTYLIAYGAAALAAVILAPAGLAELFERAWTRHPALPAPSRPTTTPRRAATSAALALDNASKRFGGVVAVDGVTLDLKSGEILVLIGANGSGKSTLINLATGFAAPDSGRIAINGEDVTGDPAHAVARRGVARTFQATDLVEDASALDNVALACAARTGAERLTSWSPRGSADMTAGRAEARWWLARFGGAGTEGQMACDLPAGARRLVECARAAAQNPLALVLDEPGAGLSAAEKAALAERLRELARGGTGILIADHDMEFLFAIADRVACLDRGRLVALGSPQEVRNDPAIFAAYLGNAP
ncbi:MAG: ABC transporter permease subunit [Alphaproteobacteria bacterium]